MKLSLAIAATMAAAAIATPTWKPSEHYKNKSPKEDKKGKAPAKPVKDDYKVDDSDVFKFTSTYEVHATPKQVIGPDGKPTGGLQGASGLYLLGINSNENTICYNITLYNFRGEYQSAARTATHIHEAAKGANGPPRIAFENPEEIAPGVRRTVGCQTGPFTPVLTPMGSTVDTAEGFHVKQIEANPDGFFADVHSSEAVPGAVRGQLSGKPC